MSVSDENSQQTRNEGNFLNLIKFVYEQPSANIILYAEIFNANETRTSVLTISTHHCTGGWPFQLGKKRRDRLKR